MQGGLAPISCLAETPKRDNKTRQARPRHTSTSTILKMLATWVALQILRHMTPNFPYWGESLTLLWHATRGHTEMGQTSPKRTARSTLNRHSMIILVILLGFLMQGAEAATPGSDYISRVRDTAQIKILDCFLAYQQRKQCGGYESEEEEQQTDMDLRTTDAVRGDSLPTNDHLIICTANASQGLAKYTRWSDLLGLADSKNADIVIISEPGKKATENALKWGTHHISPNDASTHDKRRTLGASNLSHMNYLVYAAHGQEGDGEGGVVLLLHERWRHRVQHVERHSRGRWLKLSIQTPVGVITVIGYYGRPSPQSTPQATADWQAVQHMVHKHHAKGNIVVVAGDFNLSFNTPTHRQNVSKSTLQHTMLQSALATSGLSDTFIHRHSKATKYFTWEQRKEGDHPVWTSPDHILISSLAANRVTAVQLDETTLARSMDHVMVTAAIHINSNTVIKRQHHPKLTVKTENQEQYNQLVSEHMLLNSDESKTNTETRIHNLHEAMTTAALTIKPQHVHRSKGKIGTKLQADIRILGTALRCINRDTQIPQHILKSDIYTNLSDTTAESVAAEIKTLQHRLHRKAEKRTQIRARMYKFNRSEHFRNRNYGAFLNSALNKVTNFTGIEGVHTTTEDGTPAVDMDPHTTKQVASERIQQMHFTASIPEPAYYSTRTEEDWDKMEPWFKEMFHTTRTPKPHQRYEHIMNAVGLKELLFRIKCLKKNKAGGRSRVTADLIQLLDETTVSEWLLPLVNDCLADEDLPPTAKLFAVWAIEKVPGAGSIITSSGKLNIRPITLLEPIFKLIEAIIHSRLQKAMTKAGALNPNHYGFTHGTGADDLMLEESMIFEDANQHRKEIHASNNDCSAAYDSITMWGSETIYQYHGLPPNLIRFMLNIDKHQSGHVLTAHGASEDFNKDCGLGQGSMLAPLKWKLFLDPLLKKLDQTGEPYKMGAGSNNVHIYAAAFADDLTVVAPTHKDYVLRMEFANKYLSFFGVELNAVKTTYTYANTGHHHHPINIWNRHTHTTAPSSVAAPTKALRYLGSWLSPSLRSKKGKTMLLASIHSILNVLQYKHLDWKEYRYIIQAVVESKAMYYLNVAPFTDAELLSLDRRIAGQFKRTLRLARSTSSHILYLPESQRGFALPSIKQRRDALLIRQAYRLLNDPGQLGKVFRTRLIDFKLVTGDTINPLDKPTTHNKSLQQPLVCPYSPCPPHKRTQNNHISQVEFYSARDSNYSLRKGG